MTKLRENFLLMMMTNLSTAIVVFVILTMNDTAVNIKRDIENTNTTMAVFSLITFVLILLNIFVLFKIRKTHKQAQNYSSESKVSNKVVQMKEYYKLENLRREEEVSLEVRNYSIRTMAPYMSVDNIEFLCINIDGWTKNKGIALKPLDVSIALSSLDLRHFAWNIGERLGWTGQQRAQFIKKTFPKPLQDLEIETIRRNLRQKGTCQIKIDVPVHGDFHFQL